LTKRIGQRLWFFSYFSGGENYQMTIKIKWEMSENFTNQHNFHSLCKWQIYKELSLFFATFWSWVKSDCYTYIQMYLNNEVPQVWQHYHTIQCTKKKPLWNCQGWFQKAAFVTV
jgi:hypothetical protein